MHDVIIRDDDTNSFTPVECLERLYRPFLDRQLPVNLAVIPDVDTRASTAAGEPEGFLLAKNGCPEPSLAIGANKPLVRYILDHRGYHVLQHGCHHDYFEFDRHSPAELAGRLDLGSRLLTDAGFEKPQTFVAPYDRISRRAFCEIAKRFPVLSTGWFELARLPRTWWPRYLVKKLRAQPHWRAGGALLLSHPGCLLSCHRNYDSMLDAIIQSIQSRKLTVLVTHWWEYFRGGQPDEPFIRVLHQTAEYLANNPRIRVISFDDARG